MFHIRHSPKRSALAVAITASLVALTAPTAFGAHNARYSRASSLTQQSTLPSSGEHDPWWSRYSHSSTRQHASVPFITDTLGGRGTAHSSPWSAAPAAGAPVTGLITDTLGGNGTPNSSPFEVRMPNSVATPSGGFSWGDAGIGAGVASGLLVLLAAAGAAVRRSTSPAY
jgi:hypothetical protein